MPELEGKKYSYDKKGMGQYKKDLVKKGYIPQTMRDMNAGYTPQTQMTDEQLRKKAYGNAMLKTMVAGKRADNTTKQAIGAMQMMAQEKLMMAKQEVINHKAAAHIAGAVDSIMAENVQLKKQINLNQIQQKKTDTINQARKKPVNLTERRTGK